MPLVTICEVLMSFYLFATVIHKVCCGQKSFAGQARLCKAHARALFGRAQISALQVEVEVILAAHRLYNENNCLDGIDGLIELTTLSVVRWANQQQYRALASLSAGNYLFLQMIQPTGFNAC